VRVAWSLQSTSTCCHRLHERLEGPGRTAEQVGSLIGSHLHDTGWSEPYQADRGYAEIARQSTGRDWTDVVYRTLNPQVLGSNPRGRTALTWESRL
jgi:hypothetical protein